MEVTFEPKFDSVINSSLSQISINTTSSAPLNSSSYLKQISFSNTDDQVNKYRNFREDKMNEYMETIIEIISQDEFIDGEISKSSTFMKNVCESHEIEFIKETLMQLFTLKFTDRHILEGILVMISSIPYDIIQPQGPVMALALLQHKELELRDRAIQCYEQWNSKKGLAALKSLNCHPKWLQKYVDKIIMYIERDGID